MPVIATNSAANASLFNLNRNAAAQQNFLTQLSSGSRINSSADDAAGLAVSDQLRSNIVTLEQSSRNALQGKALLQTADGALARISDILQRQQALATQYNSGTLDAASQGFINQEYAANNAQIGLIVTSTTFNGVTLIDGSYNQTFVVGATGADAIAVDLSTVDATVATLALPATLTAVGDIALVDTAIGNLSTARSTVGAFTARFDAQSENISTQILNLQDAISSIVDVDIAEAQTNFTNAQVLTEAATAALAQANQLSTSLLTLLR